MNFIKKQLIYGKQYIKNDNFHIVFGIDNDFVRPMGVTMTSIVLNNLEENIVFHIITKYMNEKGLVYLKNFANKYNKTIFIYFINDSIFCNLPTTSHITNAMYNRFLIPELLKDMTDKVLYLDADIICLNNIMSLKDIIFKNDTIVAVVEETNDYVVQTQINKLGLQRNRYFNSGMLYINIPKWLKFNINNKLLIALREQTELKFPDQDVLNIVLENKCQYIDKKYNYTFDVRYKTNRYIYDLPDDIVFLHYVGRYKPWQKWCMHPLREKFLTYAKQSLWKDIPLDEPKSYKQMKNMGKSYAIYHHRWKSLYWYLKYTLAKIKSKL